MTTVRVLYHLARADFLERVRRYSFLIVLGLVVWLGYAVTSGRLVMSIPPNYVGEINSAWVGALMTVTVALFLGWFGFYLVKGSVSRDYETGVGQILATTSLSRPLYALGKWLSNAAVLGVMILILMAAGVAMNLLVGQAPLAGWALMSPLVFLALPCLAIVAALAVLFDTIGWLRGGLGNIVYFFLFMLLLAPAFEIQPYQPLLDFTGTRLVADSIGQAAQLAYPESEGGFSFQILNAVASPQRFHYDGLDWTANVLLARLFFVAAAFGLAMLSAAFFDRFNASKAPLGGRQRRKAAAPPTAVADPTPVPAVRLTPLDSARRFRFHALYLAELKLLLKGQRWWWYAVSAGLVIAQLAVRSDDRPFVLAISWFWIILLLSGLGNREALHRTSEIVFSAPRPARNQLPAVWLAAVTVVVLMGSGAFVRYLLGGEAARLLAWSGGVLFIPSLALAMGVLTLSRKPFEVVYVTWMYLILNEAAPLDFVGVTLGSPWYVYVLLALGLLALTTLVRQRQVSGGRLS